MGELAVYSYLTAAAELTTMAWLHGAAATIPRLTAEMTMAKVEASIVLVNIEEGSLSLS